MKFLCDRCKTRYSIGDERVRGKILKIRCKNCANVITVREGMPEADADPAARRGRLTTMAPAAFVDLPAHDPASGPANGRGDAAPPPALEEEWYVSIDGDQAGPFTLAEAQRWVASKPADAELHCWTEGFDDWQPVEKVSHFRTLRKKASPPPAPPPPPRSPSGPVRSPLAAQAVEDTPRPLFAATMASLERSAAAAAATTPARPAVPGLGSVGPRPQATPASGHPALTNGAAARSPGRALGFDSSDSGDAGDAADSATVLEPAPFEDEAKTAAEPVAATARRMSERVAAVSSPKSGPIAAPGPTPLAPMPPPPTPEHDDIDIGEVSRVVKLADLVKPASRGAQKRTGSIASLAGAAAVPNRTSSIPVPLVAAVEAPPKPEVMLEPMPELGPPPTVAHHRGLIALLIGAAALVGAAVIVVLVVVDRNHTESTSLGGKYDVSTVRPDQIVVRPGDPTPIQPQAPEPDKKLPTPWKQPPRPTPTRPVQPPPPTAGQLDADDIEEMARLNSGTTQRCYLRSQRGADGILLADVKKISVTLVIAPDGTVKDISLSDNHAQNSLGKCLIAAMRSWKFKPSAGGTFRFSLHFG